MLTLNNRIFKSTVLVILLLSVGSLWGCKSQDKEEEIFQSSGEIAEGYRHIYEKADRENKLNSLETEEEIVDYLGEQGYAAIDSKNQIDMRNWKKIDKFCKKAQKGEKDKTKIFTVIGGDFIRYDLETDQRKIRVTVSGLKWNNGKPEGDYFREFQAHTWKYTEKGYFFIEEYHPPGFDGAPGQIGFRVKPLDKTYRELNRKYVLPVGYEQNNLLITDWSEQDYANLELYDAYEVMYYMKYKEHVPYDTDYGSAEYEIPGTEFEEVLQSYLQIESKDIRQNTVYYPDRQTYRYRPRGLYDSGFPYEPYPEVVAYEKQDDGTIRLRIEAVWESKETDRAVISDLVVRPLEEGRFQYVSNTVVHVEEESDSGEAIRTQWYIPRLTDEEWENYGKGELSPDV